MTTKEVYQEKVETQLKVWADRIERLKAEAGTQDQGQFNELINRQDEVMQRLQELKQASDDAWEDLRINVEKALTAMEESFDQITEKAAQAGRLGWVQGMAERREFDSEGWVEGMGHRTGHSEGWAEGVGYQSEDSAGWAEGMKKDR